MGEVSIDKYLNKYAKKLHSSPDARWTWNSDMVIADAISSAARHVRKDGCHELDGVERLELKRLEKYFAAYAEDETRLIPDQADWLYAEAMFLLQKWFTRLWD